MDDSAIDLSTVGNPYNFTRPVTDPFRFSGREQLLEDVYYYLDQAKLGGQLTNLAIIGPRAAGKTSLLNQVGQAARDRHFCVASLTLNIGDVRTDLDFFFKLFDAVISAACDFDLGSEGSAFPFGGRVGRTYQAYLDMTSAFVAPTDRKWAPFHFPRAYSQAVPAKNLDLVLPESRLVEDFRLIADEVDAPFAILIDESDALSLNEAILQRIRTIFSSLPGYMLIIAGTPDMFPVLSKVFSPMPRGFKRLSVGPFDDLREAEQCIFAPLKSIGIRWPENLVPASTKADLIGPRGLTGDEPYQIQLVCHFLFRHMQEKSSRLMALDLDVLDAVLNEIEGGQDILKSRLVSSIRDLSKDQLELLRVLCFMDGTATLEQTLFVRQIQSPTAVGSVDTLQRALDGFVESRVLRIDDRRISLNGDQREKLYVKYLVRRRGTSFRLIPQHPVTVASQILRSELTRDLKWRALGYGASSEVLRRVNSDLFAAVRSVFSKGSVGIFSQFSVDDARLVANVATDAYMQLVSSSPLPDAKHYWAHIQIMSPWFELGLPFIGTDLGSDTLDSFRHRAESIASSLEMHDGRLFVEMGEFPSVDLQNTATVLQELLPPKRRSALAAFHVNEMRLLYSESLKNAQILDIHEKLTTGFGFETVRDSQVLNDFAYMSLLHENYAYAEQLFLDAATRESQDSFQALVSFNLATCAAGTGRVRDAIDCLERCIKITTHLSKLEREMGYLYQFELYEKKLVLREVLRPDIDDLARKNLDVLRLVLDD